MKLYANDQVNNTSTEFDQYLGKDIWIKCTLSYNEHWERYCRIIGKRELPWGTLIEYNAISSTDLMELDLLPKDKIRKLLTTEYSDYVSNLIIVQPIKTNESSKLNALLGDVSHYETTESIIDRYVGKDVWIKVKIEGSALIRYIKILEKDRYYIKFIDIYAGYVEEHYELDPDDSVYSLMHPNRSHQTHIDTITIVEPMEIMTTEEIQEELEQCPEFDSDQFDEEDIEEDDLEEGADLDEEDDE